MWAIATVAWSVRLSVGHTDDPAEPCINVSTDRNAAVWGVDSSGPKEPRVSWGADANWRHLANTIERSALDGDASCCYR